MGKFFCFLAVTFILLPLFPMWSENTEVYQSVNSVRLENGALPLKIDPAAMKTAAVYAREIVTEGQFSHVDSNGNRGIDRYRLNGGRAVKVGEVLGKGKDFQTIFKAWRSSGKHNKVLIDPVWTHYGLGIAEMPDGGIVIVLLFTRLLFEDLLIGPHPEKTGIIVVGEFLGEGQGAVVINGKWILLPSQPFFSIYFEEACMLYFIRFGYMENNRFIQTETHVFESNSS